MRDSSLWFLNRYSKLKHALHKMQLKFFHRWRPPTPLAISKQKWKMAAFTATFVKELVDALVDWCTKWLSCGLIVTWDATALHWHCKIEIAITYTSEPPLHTNEELLGPRYRKVIFTEPIIHLKTTSVSRTMLTKIMPASHIMLTATS